MNQVCRRRFLQAAGGSAAALIAASSTGQPTEPEEKVAKFRLGIVTYNIAAAWDLPTILQICKNVGLSPVELRTTHKHDVEPSLSKDQRREVRRRFSDAGIECWGCGGLCGFHSPDPALVRTHSDTSKHLTPPPPHLSPPA